MKKILLLLFIVFSFSNAEDTCPKNWTKGGSWDHHTFNYRVESMPSEGVQVVHSSISGPRLIVYRVRTGYSEPYPCTNAPYYDCQSGEQYFYSCSCKMRDKHNNIPDGYKVLDMNLSTVCGDDPDDVDKVHQECQDRGGIMFTTSIVKCCADEVCIVDENYTAPDDNSTEPISCPIDSSYSPFTKKCECNPGYYPGNECHNDDCSDLECIADPCTLPNSHYSSSSSSCVCNDGYTPRYGLNSLEECISSPDTNSSDGSSNDDPCSYQDSENGFSYKGKNYDSSICQDNIKEFGCGNGTFVKHDGCSFGACYYNYDLDCPQDDSNSTGGSSNDSDTNDNSIDDNNTGSSSVDNNSSTSLALDKLDKSINGVGDKITDAVKNNTHVLSDKLSILDSTISSGFDKLHNDLTRPTHIPSTNDLKIDSSKVSSITSKVSDLESKIKDSTNLMQDVIKEYTNFASNLKDSFNSLKDNLTSYQEMFDNKPTVSISAGGSCNLSVNVFGHTVDFGAGLDKSLSVFAPIFKFVLSLATQLSLIFISIRFFRKD